MFEWVPVPEMKTVVETVRATKGTPRNNKRVRIFFHHGLNYIFPALFSTWAFQSMVTGAISHRCLLWLQCFCDEEAWEEMWFQHFFLIEFSLLSFVVALPFISSPCCENGENCPAAVLLPGHVFIRLSSLPLHKVSPDTHTVNDYYFYLI